MIPSQCVVVFQKQGVFRGQSAVVYQYYRVVVDVDKLFDLVDLVADAIDVYL